jgi:hypothetical protein
MSHFLRKFVAITCGNCRIFGAFLAHLLAAMSEFGTSLAQLLAENGANGAKLAAIGAISAKNEN